MIQKVYHKIRSDEIHSEAIKDYHIPTGEVHGAKLKDSSVYDSKIVDLDGSKIHDASIDLSAKGIPASISDNLVPTGEVHGSKIAVNTMPGDRILDASLDLTAKGIDGSLTAAKIKYQIIDVTSVPDVDTEVAHNLGVTPTFVILKPVTGGVTGFLLENKSARSATSITIRASVSGVDAEIILIA